MYARLAIFSLVCSTFKLGVITVELGQCISGCVTLIEILIIIKSTLIAR
jgi:hypothetical protein